MKKTFILMRHAKSDWYADGASDFERPLNVRGREASDKVGRYLQSMNIVPEEILHSSARRTTETTQRVVKAAGWGLIGKNHVRVRKSDEIYLCSSHQLLQL